MKFEHLSEDQQEQMLVSRMAGFEQDYFMHQTNLRLLENANGKDVKSINETKNALKTIDKAYEDTAVLLQEVRDRMLKKETEEEE